MRIYIVTTAEGKFQQIITDDTLTDAEVRAAIRAKYERQGLPIQSIKREKKR